jgi:predicted RNase H-like HicB family nuclease
MRNDDRLLEYTLQVCELRPGDFVARAAAFPSLVALGETADAAIGRAMSLLTCEVRDVRSYGEAVPVDARGELGAGQWRVVVRIDG